MNRNLGSTDYASSLSPVPGGPTAGVPIRLGRPLAALLTVIIIGVTPPSVSAVTKTVCPNGTCDYTTIQGAADSIPLGPDVIISVQPGIYRQSVVVDRKSGTALAHAVINATPGTVTIDGSNPLTTWQQHSGAVYYAPNVANLVLPDAQLWVNDQRYRYISGAGFDTLDTAEYGYDAGLDRLYTNVGGGSPASLSVYVSVRSNGFDVDSTNYLEITGFTVLRSASRGIDVRGGFLKPNESEGVSIKYCTSARNWRQGIYVERAHNFNVNGNSTYLNGRHGIYVFDSEDGEVGSNESFNNDNPIVAGIAGGMAGIKIGESSNAADVRRVVVEYNTVHDNEDSGIDLDGASLILVRRNLSYSNGDHGYDNNDTDSTTFLNNVAANNDHDGISVESTASHVSVFNCILAYNALDGTTLKPGSTEDVAELWFGGSALASDYNIMVGHGAANFGGGRLRGLVQFNGVLYNDFALYQAASSQDDSSHAADPMFADTLSANYQIGSAASVAMDRAKADLTGWTSPWWTSVDLRGFQAHDNDSIPNRGTGSVPYAEIGAYEYDIKPAAMESVVVDLVSSSSIHLKWKTSGDDGRVGRAPSACLRTSESAITEATFGTPVGNTVPSYPGQWRDTTFSGLPMCTLYYFGLKYGGGNNLWADLGDTARAVTSPIWYEGHWVCDEGLRAGDNFSAVKARRGAVAGARLAGETWMASAAGTSGSPVSVEVVQGEGRLDVKVVVLRGEDTPGYQEGGGGGVMYQEPDESGGWTTRLRYALPEGSSWALLAPERPGRWVFLEALSLQAVLTTAVAGGTEWRLEEVNHSRLGDVTAAWKPGGHPAALIGGDTLSVHYSGIPAEDQSLPSWLVALGRPTGTTTPSRAAGGGRLTNSSLPAVFALHQNLPNPFAVATTFRIDLPLPGTVRLEVFDLLGRKVAKLQDAWMPAGRHSISWEGRDARGTAVRPGAYLYRLTAGSFRAERKLVVVP